MLFVFFLKMGYPGRPSNKSQIHWLIITFPNYNTVSTMSKNWTLKSRLPAAFSYIFDQKEVPSQGKLHRGRGDPHSTAHAQSRLHLDPRNGRSMLKKYVDIYKIWINDMFIYDMFRFYRYDILLRYGEIMEINGMFFWRYKWEIRGMEDGIEHHRYIVPHSPTHVVSSPIAPCFQDGMENWGAMVLRHQKWCRRRICGSQWEDWPATNQQDLVR